MVENRVQSMLKLLDEYGYTLADLSELFDTISQCNGELKCTIPEKNTEQQFDKQKTSAEEESKIKLKIRITEILLELGFKESMNGFNCTRDAIMMSYYNPEYLKHVTTKIYVNLGDIYKKSNYAVERAIRHSIEVAWDCGNVDIYEKYFGYSVNVNRGKPSNGQFITTIVDYLKLHS